MRCRSVAVAMSGCAVLALGPVTGTTASAVPAPAPATSVVLTGTPVPQQVAVSWTRPSDSAYAGAHVVVTPGTGAATGPEDARAVFVADVDAPGASTTWGGEAGRTYTVSVFAYEAGRTRFASPAVASLRLPSPASHIVIDNYRNRIFTALWVLDAGADEAIVCFRRGSAPAAPAEADACSPPGRYYAAFEPPAGSPFDPPAALDQFVVFARSSATGVLAPPASYAGEAPPPFPPTALDTAAVSSTKVRLTWSGPSATMGGYPSDSPGGQTHWVVYRFRGNAAPAEDPGGVRLAVVPVGDEPSSYLATDLVPGATYTFALRGRDSEGNLSGWSNARTTRGRVPGMYVVRDGAGPGRWGRTRAPRSRRSVGASLHVGWTSGVVHVVHGGIDHPLRHALLRPGRGWVTRTAPRGFAYADDTAVGPRGQLATIVWPYGPCVALRSRAGWRPVHCLTGAVNDGQLDLEFDHSGRLHVIYSTGAAGLRYVTNASGSWRTSAITSTSTAEALLGYDGVADTLVVAVQGGDTGHDLSVATKRARAARFGGLRSWVPGRQDEYVQPTSLVSRGGRVTVAGLLRPGSAPVLVTGSLGGASGRLGRIKGVDEGGFPQVAATSRRGLVVAWTDAGTWVSRGSWAAGRRAWRLTPAERLTRFAYDQVLGIGVDGHGRSDVLVHRNAQDQLETLT